MDSVMHTELRRVPLIRPDLPDFDAVEESFREIMLNGRITNFGRFVNEFEAASARHLGAGVATTSSGTMGLLFAMQALGIKPGDKVIIPSFTFMATAQAVEYAGAQPILADVLDDLTLDPHDVAAIADEHDISAVIPVHMYGLPADVDAIEAAVGGSGRRARIICDAAHAFGSQRDDRKVGTFGDAEVFSLSVTKVLVSVEGGMVASRNEALIERIRHMRNYGIESKYDAWYPGLNGKMSEFHAIVGLENLKLLDERMAARQTLARYYRDAITDRTSFLLAAWPENVVHTFKDFSILMTDPLAGKRQSVIDMLAERGIETRAYFDPPVHRQQRFARYATRTLPNTDRLAPRVLTLPFFTTMTHDDVDYVVDALRAAEDALS